MIPGELLIDGPDHVLNPGRRTHTLVVVNASERPIQVGSHYHFAETNGALGFDRTAAQGMRLNIASGSAVRFEPGQHALNVGRRTCTVVVHNASDRPIQVGSHYHFAETNAGLRFDRAAAHGMRLNIASGMAVRFEPGQQRTVELVDYAGDRVVYGFRGLMQGKL